MYTLIRFTVICYVSFLASFLLILTSTEIAVAAKKPRKTCLNTSLNQMNCDPKPHVVFFIHGLQGDTSTFQDLESILYNEYGDVKNLSIANLEYPTNPAFNPLNSKIGSDVSTAIADGVGRLQVYDFAKIINTKIISYMIEEGIRNRDDCTKTFKVQPINLLKCFQNSIDLNTTYSFIVHSQGSLVAMSYLNSCHRYKGKGKKCRYEDGLKIYKDVIGQRNFNTEQLAYIEKVVFKELIPKKSLPYNMPNKNDEADTPQNITNIISLGGPFWGSPTANVSVDNKAIMDVRVSKFISNRQLNDLAIGSVNLTHQRNLMLNRETLFETGKWQSPYPQNLKFYNLMGVKESTDNSWYNSGLIARTAKNTLHWAVEKLTKSEHLQNDIIVGANEARTDFVYHIEDPEGNAKPAKGITGFTKGSYAINLAHLPFSFMDVNGLTCFVEANNLYKKCPSYGFIKYVLHTEFEMEPDFSALDPLEDKMIDRITTFTSEIKLYTPIGYQRKFKIANKDVNITAQNPGDFSEKLRLDDELFAKTYGQNIQASKINEHYYQTYYHIGKLTNDNGFNPMIKGKDVNALFKTSQGGFKLDYNLKVFGFEAKSVTGIGVLPNVNSYAELYLKPYLPIPSSKIVSGETTKLTEFKINKLQKRVIYIDEQFNLNSYVVNLSTDFKPSCRLGVMALTTPERFKHSLKAGLEKSDKDKNNGSDIIKKYQTSKDFEPERQATSLHLWNKYASNRNKLFWQFHEPNYSDKDLNYKPSYNTGRPIEKYQMLKPGTAIEVLARVSAGYRDAQSGITRNCTPKEKQNNGNSCDKPAFDRYLITSPKIRKRDGLKSFKQINTRNLKMYTKGLRWVNVADVDLLNDKETLPVKPWKNKKVRMLQQKPNECLFDSLKRKYYPAKTYIEHFYRPDVSRFGENYNKLRRKFIESRE